MHPARQAYVEEEPDVSYPTCPPNSHIYTLQYGNVHMISQRLASLRIEGSIQDGLEEHRLMDMVRYDRTQIWVSTLRIYVRPSIPVLW